MQKEFSLLIKPASADCNLSCTYCFYLPKASLYPETSRHRMSKATLERIIASYLATKQTTYGFGWQGGEPTLMGIDFFQKVVELQKKYAAANSVISNGLQTNATLITEDMARFFGEYRFLIGISLDGPEEIHDINRKYRNGKGSYGQVIKGIELLKKYQVEFNILTAVNAANVGKASEIYRFLLDLGVRYQQYIPIVEFDDNNRPLPFSIDGNQWGEFLKEIYELWYPHAGGVSIRLFDAILTYLVEGSQSICTMGRDCRQYFMVEHNGDIYPCDFFAQSDLRLGNIMDNEWSDLLESPRYEAFGQQKSQWNDICNDCPYLDLCMGDCLKHRFRGAKSISDPRELSWLCSGWKSFYQFALPGFKRIARRIQRSRSREIREHLASLSDIY